MITLLSVLFLTEKVRIRSWVALLVGFVGTLIVVHPGMGTCNSGLYIFYANRQQPTPTPVTTD